MAVVEFVTKPVFIPIFLVNPQVFTINGSDGVRDRGYVYLPFAFSKASGLYHNLLL